MVGDELIPVIFSPVLGELILNLGEAGPEGAHHHQQQQEMGEASAARVENYLTGHLSGESKKS